MTIVHESHTWRNSFYKFIFIIIQIFTKLISFTCEFAVFYFFSEHSWVAALDYDSILSIILDIFRKKPNVFNINLFPMAIKL